MIIEHALVRIDPADRESFEADARAALPLITSAAGCHGAEFRRQHEDDTTYLLLVRWESVDAHLEFRATELFTQWRALTHPHYVSPAEVTHYLEPIAR